MLTSSRTPLLHDWHAADEAEAGRSLATEDVENIVSDANGIMMEIADARQLERARGYGDISPELAWEQWQIVRHLVSAPAPDSGDVSELRRAVGSPRRLHQRLFCARPLR